MKGDMRVDKVMTEQVEVAETYMMLDEAAELMRASDVGALPVVEGGRLLGVITDRDIVVRAVAHGDDPSQTTVGETMTSNGVAISEDQTIERAMGLMAEYQIRRLPVVDGERRVVGMVSLGDLSLRADSDAPVADTLRAISQGLG
jgi:CBS domain-containing protein